MRTKKWAKHIIEKFGHYDAFIFANSYRNCPCSVLDWECCGCQYHKTFYWCKPAKKWMKLCSYEIYKIKNKIKEMLLKIEN